MTVAEFSRDNMFFYQGREEGREEGIESVAKNLLRKGLLTVSEIAESTGLSEDEIELLKREL